MIDSEPTANPAASTAASQDEDLHDLLIIPKGGSLYQAKAGVTGDPYGYASVRKLPFTDVAYRKAMGIAAPGGPGEAPRGPAFAILPNKPDPSTSQICCYLVNGANARASNVWTAAAWNSEPSNEDKGLKAPIPPPVAMDFVVAGPDGNAYRIQLNTARSATVTALELEKEGEIYGQLRNGLVAGSASCFAARRVLPLVNIASLMLEAPPAQPAGEQS